MARGRTAKPGLKKKPRSREGSGVRKIHRYLEKIKEINPTDYDLLRKFLTDHGKIIPSRLTGAAAKQQRQIKAAIGRARVMGLLP